MTLKRDIIDLASTCEDLFEAALVQIHRIFATLDNPRREEKTDFDDPNRADDRAEFGLTLIFIHAGLHKCLGLRGHPRECSEVVDGNAVDKPPENLKGAIFAALFDKQGPRTPQDLVHYFECRYDWVSEVLRQLYLEGKVVALGRKKPPFDLDTELRVTKRE